MAATTGLVETLRSAAPKPTFSHVVEINSPEVAESNCEAKLPKLPERCFSAHFLCVLFAETKSKGVKHRQGTRLQPREFHRPPSLFQQMVCSRCAMLPTRSFSSPGFRRAPVKLQRAELLTVVAEGSQLPGLPVYLVLGSPGRPATLRTREAPGPHIPAPLALATDNHPLWLAVSMGSPDMPIYHAGESRRKLFHINCPFFWHLEVSL